MSQIFPVCPGMPLLELQKYCVMLAAGALDTGVVRSWDTGALLAASPSSCGSSGRVSPWWATHRSSLRCLQKEIFELRSSPSNRVDEFFSSSRFILIRTEDWIMCLTSPNPQFKFHASIDLLLVLKSQLLNNFHFWSLFFLKLSFRPYNFQMMHISP